METYEGLATESPDTRPGPSDRFDGMRVWTTDTRRLFVWVEALARWMILSEPAQTLVAADFVLQQASTTVTKTAGACWYQRQYDTFTLRVNLTATSAGSAGNILLTLPSVLTMAAGFNAGGEVVLADADGSYYLGSVGQSGSTGLLLLTQNGVSPPNFGPIVLASGDAIGATVFGRLA